MQKSFLVLWIYLLKDIGKSCLDFLFGFCLLSEQRPMKLVETILQGWHEFGGAVGVCLELKGGGGSVKLPIMFKYINTGWPISNRNGIIW